MALVLKDRVQETTTTTGTGTLTLGGAVTGYQSFSAIGNANTTYYAIYASGGSEWEVGIGTYTASGTTLSRDTVLSSSNSGSLVSFSAGTKNVWCNYPAGKAVYQDANGEITGTTINANTKFVSENYYAQSILGGNLRTSGGTSLVNWDGGGSGNVTFNGGISASPANKNIVLSPSGTGVVTINPATAGSMNNVIIGATTPAAITGTTVTATTFSGSGASLTSIPNSALNNSAITINGTSTSLGGSIGVGTVTSVTGTSPVVSSGGATPAISMPAATTSVSGYLTSTDWNTFNSKGSGTVTSVSATAPITSSGGATPNLAMPAATGSVNGYLTSTDWTTFNSKGSGTVTSVAALTLGTTGTDLSSTVATGTTTPVITLQVPTASASNRGALSSTDWSTFNGKAPSVTYTTNYVPFGQGTTTPNLSSSFTYVTGTGTLTSPVVSASNGLHLNSATVSASFSIPSGSNAMSVGPITVASGQSVTVPSGSKWVVL